MAKARGATHGNTLIRWLPYAYSEANTARLLGITARS